MKRLIILLLLLACCSLGLAAQSPDRAFWVARYKQIEKLFNERDAQSVEQMLADKFAIIDEHGRKHSRADFVKDELETVAQANFSQNTVQIRWMRQRGPNVDIAYDWRYSLAFDDPKSGRYKIHGHEVGVDTWHKFGNTWLSVRTKIEKASQTKRKGS